ncbi:hypothetical protein MyNCGM683_02720 [Achromobacter xylosoxidans]
MIYQSIRHCAPPPPSGSARRQIPSLAEMDDRTEPKLDGHNAQVAKALDAFEGYFQQEANTIASNVDPAGVVSFNRDVQARFEALLERAFAPLPFNNSARDPVEFDKAMRTATNRAVMALERLKVDAARADLLSNLPAVDYRPQIIPHEGRFMVIRPAPPWENIVLRGGGAKGIGYSASLEQLEKAGLLAHVRHLAGSSAGALTASCLAAGLSATEFEEGPADVLFRPGILSGMKFRTELARIYPNLRTTGGFLSALTALSAIDQAMSRSVQRYLSEHWHTERFQEEMAAQSGQGRLDKRQLERLSMLTQLPDFDQPHENYMITFRDLDLLNQLAPEKFRKLTLTAWNKTDRREDYFNAETTPDIPVAYAARMSMAFPIAFQAVSIKGKKNGGRNRVYSDGGIGSNIPSEVFINDDYDQAHVLASVRRGLEQTRARTLLLTFDEHGEAYRIQHGAPPKKLRLSVKSRMEMGVIGCASRNAHMATVYLNDERKVWDAGPNALPVFHGKAGTLTSNISDWAQHQIHMQAAWKTLEQIAHRVQQAYSMEYESLEALTMQLTDREIKALRDGAKPDEWQRQLLALLDARSSSMAVAS